MADKIKGASKEDKNDGIPRREKRKHQKDLQLSAIIWEREK